MPDDPGPRVRLRIPVGGATYDDLVAQARRAAAEFLGDDRRYWLDMGDVQPEVETGSGEVITWEGDATVVYPPTPEF